MSHTVYKYPIPADPEWTLEVPGHRWVTNSPRVLMVGLDAERRPCIWLEVVDYTPARYTVKLHTVVTGGEIPHQCKYLGSFVEGGFIGHVYSSEMEKA